MDFERIFKTMKDTILFGDCKETLSEFAPQSARTCVTSPPYYGLRDYGTATWIGGDPNCSHKRDSKVKAENCNTGHKNHDEMYVYVLCYNSLL